MKKKIFFNFSYEQKNRIKNNFVSLLSNFSSKILIQILFPPLMIMFWGVENFGIWIFITAIPSTFSILNLNFSQAAKIEMTLNYSKNKKKLVNVNFHNGFALIIMNMFIFTIIWSAAYLINGLNLKIFENISIDNIKTVIFLVILSFYFTIFDSILATGISYWGKLYIYTYIKSLSEILIKLLVVIVGFFSDNLIYASIVFFLISLTRTLLLYYFFLINKKYVFLSLKYLDIKNLLKLFKLSLSYYAETIVQIIKHNCLIIVLGIFFTAEVIGLISTAKTLFYFFPIFFIAIFNHTSMYEYTENIGKKFFDFVKRGFKLHMLISFTFVTLFVLSSIAFGSLIYNFWTNYNYKLNLFY